MNQDQWWKLWRIFRKWRTGNWNRLLEGQKFLATYFRGNVSSQRKTTGLAQKTEKGKWILDCRGKCENYRHLLYFNFTIIIWQKYREINGFANIAIACY